MDTNIDLLQIKIEKAKVDMPKEALDAISKVAWRDVVLSMRQKKGYSFDQLETLELETELLLCGLVSPSEYGKELGDRMKLPKQQIDALVNDMNELVFKKIREEMIKASEKKEVLGENNIEIKRETAEIHKIITNQETENTVLKNTGVNIIKKIEEKPIVVENVAELMHKIENPTPTPSTIPTKVVPSISQQKFTNSFQTETKKTEYELKQDAPVVVKEEPKILTKVDPYRLSPED